MNTKLRFVQETRRDGIGSSSGYTVETRARNQKRNRICNVTHHAVVFESCLK